MALLLLILLIQRPQPARLFCTVQTASTLRCDLDSWRIDQAVGYYDDEDKPFTVRAGRSWRPLLRDLRGSTPFPVEVDERGRLWLLGVGGPRLKEK